MHVGRDVALAHTHFEVDAEIAVFGKGGDQHVLGEHRDVMIALNGAGPNFALFLGKQGKPLGLVGGHGQPHLFKIEDNLGDILNDSRNRGKFVLHPFNAGGDDGRALQGRQEHATQGVAERGAEPAFQGLAHEPSEGLGGARVLFQDFGLDEFGPVAGVDEPLAVTSQHGVTLGKGSLPITWSKAQR